MNGEENWLDLKWPKDYNVYVHYSSSNVAAKFDYGLNFGKTFVTSIIVFCHCCWVFCSKYHYFFLNQNCIDFRKCTFSALLTHVCNLCILLTNIDVIPIHSFSSLSVK